MDWEDIVNMTNKDAAALLRDSLRYMRGGMRGNGKTLLITAHCVALLKAIQLLEATPDKEESDE